MGDKEKTINTFATRVRQMMLSYQDVVEENGRLCAMIDERDAKIAHLEAALSQARNDYATLKMARMIEISDGDMEGARKRLAKLIRDVDKCITLLSEK